MKNRRRSSSERLQHLLEGKSEEIALRTFTSYPVITSDTDFDAFATLMLHTGYLTAKDADPSARNRAVVRIPNKEVLECFSDKIETLFSDSNPEWYSMSQDLRENLFNGNALKVSEIISKMLQSFISAAVIMEFKISKSTKASVRKKECAEALDQIERNNYDCELKEEYDSMRKFGIVFFKKTCAVMEKSQLDKTSAS